MLAKETLALPDLVDVLGQRPYPLKATLLEYLEELRERKTEDDAKTSEAAEVDHSAAEKINEADKPKEEEKKSDDNGSK